MGGLKKLWKWYFSLRRWYFFPAKCSVVGIFWKDFFSKKISQLKKKYHFSIFLKKKLSFQKLGKVNFVNWNSDIMCGFWDDFDFFPKYDHFGIFLFSWKKYHRENGSEIDFQIPLLESDFEEKKPYFFLVIRKTHSRETKIITNIQFRNLVSKSP